MSPLSAREAEAMGYTNVKVFHAGLPAWKKSGGLVVTGPVALENWQKSGSAFVLVDLREPAVASQGAIPGAIGVPAKDLASWKERFPENKKAPIVLVDAAQASPEAFALVRGWGYGNVSVLKGGLASWKGELKAGELPAPAKIEYVKKLKPGEITIDDFKKIADTRPAGTLILDVREKPVDGTFLGALAIPQSELETRAAEVPREQEIVIHCNTGILAKQSYDLLAAKGVTKARWLDAVVVVGAGGTYEVTEK
jgi:rhodanese-related sulfurtransferase